MDITNNSSTAPQTKKALICKLTLLVICMLSLSITQAQAGGRFHKAGANPNMPGGLNAGRVSGASGQNGSFLRGRAATGDGAGNVVGGSAGTFQFGSATGGRAGGFNRNASGAVQHNSGAAISGSKGTAMSSGDFSKNADGVFSGARNTTASNNNGGTYNGSTTYENGSASHSNTCINSAGQQVSCY